MRNEKLQSLASTYHKTAETVRWEELPHIDPKWVDINDYEKGVKDFKLRVDEHRKKHTEVLSPLEKLKEEIENTRKDDEEVAKTYGITVEELYKMVGTDQLEKSKQIQKNLAEGIVLLADATKGYNNRVNAASNDFLSGIKKIREKVEWTDKPDTLTTIMNTLDEVGTNKDSSLTLLTVELLQSVQSGKDYLKTYGEKQGQTEDLFVEALKTAKVDQLRMPNGQKPTNYIEVAAIIVDAAIGGQLKFQDIKEEVKAHRDWIVWKKSLPPDNRPDPNPFVPI